MYAGSLNLSSFFRHALPSRRHGRTLVHVAADEAGEHGRQRDGQGPQA
jgi:hypothetical protein